MKKIFIAVLFLLFFFQNVLADNSGSHFWSSLNRSLQFASHPSKFFFSPTSHVMRSMEVSFSGGSFYGADESGGFLTRMSLGLGNVAEMEFATSQIVNQLSGETTQFPSRMFKVQLMPQRFLSYFFVPNIAVQLRTTSWGSVIEREHQVARGVAEDFSMNYANQSLQSLNLMTRFTTLYLVAGKEGELGGLHLGLSLNDVRTKEGYQWILDNNDYSYKLYRFPKLQKNILKPFGGIIINANESTQIMAELSAIPNYRYNIKERTINIKSAWAGIAGVRFFMLPWMSWDAGVRYLSTYDGIADAEISMALNIIVPFKTNKK